MPLATHPPNLGDRYDLARELGRGGMATVWLAEERKHRRKVAVKVLRPDLAASLGAERFLREIGIVAQLAHPHIVPLIDSGDTDGQLYYVTPYASGGSLRERLVREGQLPIADAVRIAGEIGAALDFAHRGGFVHRDVKPENILFADGHALLTDFGVAQVCADCAPELRGSAVTAEGIALGTPDYMSPEQAAGERDLDARSDVYSLACVVFEMLAGEPPFRGANARATMARHVTETPRPLRALRVEVPAGIEAAVQRALAKEPAHRFAGIADFVGALQGALVTDPVMSRLARAATHSIAVLPFVNASPNPENEYLSDGISDELIDALTKLEGVRVASRTSVFALKGKQLDVRAIGALLGTSVVLEGSVRSAGSRLRVTAQLTSTEDGRLLWSQRYDRELDDVFAVQDELARTIVDTLRATWLADLAEPASKRGTASVGAYALYLRGRWALNKRSREGTAEAITWFEKAIAEDPRYALAYTGLSDAYALHVDYRSVPVHEGLERAEEYARRALAIDDSLAEAHASLAWKQFIYDWNWRGAEASFRRAIALDPRYPPAHQWYASLLTALGRHEEALVAGHTALDLDPASVSVRRSMGWQYFYARRFERARHHLERAIEMNPMAEETYRVLGLSLSSEGNHPEAVRTLREASSMPEAGSYTRSTLAFALARSGGGHLDEARGIAAELASLVEREYVSPAALATVYLGLGESELAMEWIERAHADRRGWVTYLRVNPIFDSVRDHPRFRRLENLLGLAPLS